MNTSGYPILFIATAIVFLATLPSCKEKNDEFPPKTWSEYSYADNNIALRDISTIYYENDHSLWLGAKGSEGLLHHDGYKWVTYNKANTGIAFDSVTSIIRDGNGKLWIGFRTGLATFDGNIWSNIEQMTGLRITSVVVEGIGNIRVGIKGQSGGLATLSQGIWKFETPANSGIPSGNINALVSDNEQVLWAATADIGVIRLKNTVWENISSSLPLLSENFSAITKGKDGSIWAASVVSELIHFHDDTFVLMNTGTSKPVTSVVVTDDGNVWISTAGAGLVRFNGAEWKSYTMANDASLPSDDILYLSEETPGFLQFSVPGGRFYTIKP